MSPEAVELRRRLEAGQLDRLDLHLAAFSGHAAAREALGTEAPPVASGPGDWEWGPTHAEYGSDGYTPTHGLFVGWNLAKILLPVWERAWGENSAVRKSGERFEAVSRALKLLVVADVTAAVAMRPLFLWVSDLYP